MANWDKRFLDMAKLVASWSKDPSTKQGSVIVRPDKTVASVGFNGFPKHTNDLADLYYDRTTKYSRTIHAELNSILFAKESLTCYTLYTYPLGTCDRCATAIIQSGINRVVMPQTELAPRWQDSIDNAVRMYLEAGVEVGYE